MTAEMKQQPVPWNVTGIPAEARQMARDAASREGVSVGDWLTRRILNITGRGPEPSGDETSLPPNPTVQSDDALAQRVLSIESGNETAFHNIDETLRALSARLEAAERAQFEAHRAMNTAAAEINAATREQAQAFAALTQRIEHIERNADGGPLREAVRALHQALSRLAEQVGQSAGDSAAQVNGIAGHVDNLAGQMAAAQNDISDHLSKSARQQESLADRLTLAEERLTLLTPLEDVMLQLQGRVTSAEGRLEDTFGRSFQTLARNLDGIGARLDRIERAHGDAGESVRETLHTLHQRLDAMDARHGESFGELRAGLEAAQRVRPQLEVEQTDFPDIVPEAAAPEAETPEKLVTAAETDFATGPELPSLEEFDLPQFADSPPVPVPPFIPTDSEDPAPRAGAAEPAAAVPDELPPVVVPVETHYLAAARRAAQAAANAEATHRSRSSLSSIRPQAGRGEWAERRRLPLFIAAVFVLGAGVVAFLLVRSVAPTAPVVRRGAAASVASFPPVLGPQAAAEAPAPVAPATPPSAEAGARSSPEADTVTALPAKPALPATPAPTAQAAPAFGRLLAKANAGSTPAELLLGLDYLDGTDVAANDGEGGRWLAEAAKSGEALAQYRLGTLYERGRGVAQNSAQAFFWYKQAALGGNRKAMHNLAVAYANGVGTEKNFAEAARWFRAASDYGLTDSQFNLAVLYERGFGVEASLGDAYKWYLIAASGGDMEAISRADALATQLAPSLRQSAESAAMAFAAKPYDVRANEPPAVAEVAP